MVDSTNRILYQNIDCRTTMNSLDYSNCDIASEHTASIPHRNHPDDGKLIYNFFDHE